MRIISLFIAIIYMVLPSLSYGQDDNRFVEITSPNTETSFLNVEGRARLAAVKVLTPHGHGSGSLFIINGNYIVFTAEHVVGTNAFVTIKSEEGEEIEAPVIYRDKSADIAAVMVKKMKTRTPMKFKLPRKEPGPGTNIFYSGYPAGHNLLSIRGVISGYSDNGKGAKSLIIFGYGWFGCSGSAIYDAKGHFIGILWGVDVLMSPFGIQVVEDLIWVSQSSRIDTHLLKKSICKDEYSEYRSSSSGCK